MEEVHYFYKPKAEDMVIILVVSIILWDKCANFIIVTLSGKTQV